MSQIEYFKIPKGFSDQIDRLSWSEGCDAIVLEGGQTLALSTALAQFLEGAFRNTQPIHFAYVLHFLASTKYEDHQWRRLHDLGFAVNRNSGALFAALTRQVPRLDFDFDIPEARRLLLQQTELVPVHWLETGSPELTLDVASFESGVSRVLASMTSEDIVNWLRHGRGKVPDTEPPPGLPKRDQSFTDLVEKLLKSPRLAGVSDLMQQVVAAVSIPPRSQRRTELPVGGYSSIVNRGQPDQILMSEHAVDELEFLRRYANNELLYWQREEPQNQQAEELCIVLDQGVRTWGEPRLALTAAALALGKQAEKAEMPCNFVFSGADFQSALAGGTPASHFESSDLTSNPAQALHQALSEDSTVKDIILLTHPRNLDEPEITHAAVQQSENQRLFAITVDEQGKGILHQLTTSGRIQLRTFELNIQPPKTERPKQEVAPTKDRQWTGDINEFPAPFLLGLHEEVRAIGFANGGKKLLAAGRSTGLLLWTIDTGSVEQIPPIQFEGQDVTVVEIVELPFGAFILGDTPATMQGANRVGVQVDSINKEVTAILLPAEETPYKNLAFHKAAMCVAPYLQDLPAIQVQHGKIPQLSEEKHATTEEPDSYTGKLEDRVKMSPRVYYFSIAGKSIPVNDLQPFPKEIFTEGGEIRDGRWVVAGDSLVLSATETVDLTSAAFSVFDRKDLTFKGEGRSYHRGTSPSLVATGNRVARWTITGRIEVIEFGPREKVIPFPGGKKTHSSIQAELGQNWLTLHGGKFTHLLRWDRGPLEISFMQGQKNIGEFVQKRRDASALNPHGSTATPNKLTEIYRQRWQKQCFKGNLTLLSDSTGNVAILGDEDKLIVMFHVYRGTIAAWMPDGTRYGPASLTGGPTTKGALDSIGVALSEASS